jgi:hypothetical protein
MWVLGAVGAAMVLAILTLLTWWSFIGDFQWIMFGFLGLMAVLPPCP